MIPKCSECLRKHLSFAISLGREVMSGHSAGGNPDHRSDFSGEVSNAEGHAHFIDQALVLKIRAIRRKLSSQFWKPEQKDLEDLRTIWFASYKIEDPLIIGKIKDSDPDLAKNIAIKSIAYERMPMAKESSDIKDCGCAKPKENSPQTKPVIVLYFNEHNLDTNLGFNNINSYKRMMRINSFNNLERAVRWLHENFVMYDYVLWTGQYKLIKQIQHIGQLPVIATGHVLKPEYVEILSKNGVFARNVEFFNLPIKVDLDVLGVLMQLLKENKNAIKDIAGIYASIHNLQYTDNSKGIISYDGNKTPICYYVLNTSDQMKDAK